MTNLLGVLLLVVAGCSGSTRRIVRCPDQNYEVYADMYFCSAQTAENWT